MAALWSSLRTDDLAAIPMRVLMERNPGVDWEQVDDVIYGCANQAGEDNRNVARMAALLAGLPVAVEAPRSTGCADRAWTRWDWPHAASRLAKHPLIIAGGVESMSRAPFVMPKAESAFSRTAEIYDTTIGWRFVNRVMQAQYGIDSMPETAENLAEQFNISRKDQDLFALRSQQKCKPPGRPDFSMTKSPLLRSLNARGSADR